MSTAPRACRSLNLGPLYVCVVLSALREKREEEEFGYGGEAFIARAPAPEKLDDEAWGDFLFMRKNPKGWHWEMWSHNTGCRKSPRCETQRRDERHRRIMNSLRGCRKVYDAEGGSK